MKKLIAILLVAIMVLSLAACGSSSTTDSTTTGQTTTEVNTSTEPTSTSAGTEVSNSEERQTVSIGFSLASNDETMQEFKDVMMNTWIPIKEEQYGVNIECEFADANQNVEKQVADVENFVAKGVDVISLRMVDMDGSAAACDYAAENGVPVLAAWWAVNTDSTIGTLIVVDNNYCGELMSNWIFNYAEENNVTLKCGLLYGRQAVPETNKRPAMFEKMVQERYGDLTSGQVQVVDSEYTELNVDTAMEIVEGWLVKYDCPNEMNCIFASMDDTAMGAVNVLKAAGLRDDFVVIGCNGNTWLKAVGRGDLNMTVKLDNLQSIEKELDVLLCTALGLDDQMPTLDEADKSCMIVCDPSNFEEMWEKYGNGADWRLDD